MATCSGRIVNTGKKAAYFTRLFDLALRRKNARQDLIFPESAGFRFPTISR